MKLIIKVLHVNQAIKLPEAVIVDTTNPEKLYYNESNLIPILVKAIQELSAEVERLSKRL